MPTIFRDLVTFTSPDGTAYTFNDPTDLITDNTLSAGIDILDGWYNTSPLDVIITDLGQADGSYAGARFPQRGKYLTVGGWVYADSRGEMENALYKLIGDVFPINQNLIVTRAEGSGPKMMTVRVASELTIDHTVNRGFRWTVNVFAPDPLRYTTGDYDITGTTGISSTSSGGFIFPLTFPLVFPSSSSGQTNLISAVNAGSTPTAPIITVTGPLDVGWRIANFTTGEYLSVDTALSSTDVLVIDMARQTALLNGYPITNAVHGDWWKLQRGLNVVRLYGNYNSAAQMTLKARSAWR